MNDVKDTIQVAATLFPSLGGVHGRLGIWRLASISAASPVFLELTGH